MRARCWLVLFLLPAAQASAELLFSTRNPDLPQGGVALDLFGDFQLRYHYSRFLVENIDYNRAGALTPPDLRTDDPPYERTGDAHSVGVRLRLWLGTD